MAAGRAAHLIAAESPDPVALSVRAAVPEVVMEPATRRRTRGPASKRWPALASRSPRGAAHPGNGVIAPFHGERPRNRGVKDTHRPPFSAPSSRRRPSETAIRTASPALTLKSSRPGTTNRSRLRDGVGRYEPDLRGPGPGRPGPACAMRAQRDAVRLTSRRASPARHNPPELDSREPTWRNASPGDITETTPPGAGSPLDVGAGVEQCPDDSLGAGPPPCVLPRRPAKRSARAHCRAPRPVCGGPVRRGAPGPGPGRR